MLKSIADMCALTHTQWHLVYSSPQARFSYHQGYVLDKLHKAIKKLFLRGAPFTQARFTTQYI